MWDGKNVTEPSEPSEPVNPDESIGKLKGLVAGRDHIILQNDFLADIKKGDALDDIPDRFYQTLKTEKVI